MRSSLLALVWTVAGCGAAPPSYPDADPAAPLCTGAIYDNCHGPEDCASAMCHLFNREFQVCTQACSPGDSTTCPLSANGAAAKCNNRGICKPAINNACRPDG